MQSPSTEHVVQFYERLDGGFKTIEGFERELAVNRVVGNLWLVKEIALAARSSLCDEYQRNAYTEHDDVGQ